MHVTVAVVVDLRKVNLQELGNLFFNSEIAFVEFPPKNTRTVQYDIVVLGMVNFFSTGQIVR